MKKYNLKLVYFYKKKLKLSVFFNFHFILMLKEKFLKFFSICSKNSYILKNVKFNKKVRQVKQEMKLRFKNYQT